MEEVFGFYSETVGGFWGAFLSMPLWFHFMVTAPMSLFLAWRTYYLAYGIVVGPGGVEAVPDQLIQKKGRKAIPSSGRIQLGSFASVEESLQEGFARVKSEEGARKLTRLKTEYDGLQSLLVGSKLEDTVLNLDRVAKLTSKLYQQGLGFLAQALSTAKQLDTSSPAILLEESKELEESLVKSKPGSTLHGMITERLEKNTKSLSIVKEFGEKLDEYFCQVGLCRDSIREIRLEVPELLGNKPQEELDRVMLELRTRVDFAQRVQKEYDKQGL